jgi:hypothetical protein
LGKARVDNRSCRATRPRDDPVEIAVGKIEQNVRFADDMLIESRPIEHRRKRSLLLRTERDSLTQTIRRQTLFEGAHPIKDDLGRLRSGDGLKPDDLAPAASQPHRPVEINPKVATTFRVS